MCPVSCVLQNPGLCAWEGMSGFVATGLYSQVRSVFSLQHASLLGMLHSTLAEAVTSCIYASHCVPLKQEPSCLVCAAFCIGALLYLLACSNP
jgi:hypothetical protein